MIGLVITTRRYSREFEVLINLPNTITSASRRTDVIAFGSTAW
ncbi:hypothetical protein BPTFM16_02130 [Altererythrobacter insulae]|nr:hypothetical protein BPTFM16_02130 [Altererythrobacter insulae]